MAFVFDENDIGNKNLSDVGECLYVKKRSAFNTFTNVLLIVLCFVFVVEIAFNTFFTGIYVVNVSMRPNFIGAAHAGESGGDYIYVNKYAKPDYGDVVVVYREEINVHGEVDKGNIIKRVMAFGGDWIEIVEGVVYVNDERVVEDYIDPDYNDPGQNNFSRHQVEDGCMFLLGDNRNESKDSRETCDYPIKDLVGVVPQWSIALKPVTTALYTFFNYTIFGK